MLSPKRIKFRKKQRGTRDAVAHRGNTLAFGEYGLMATEPRWITNRQIEAARVAMTRHVKRGGKVWIFNGEIYDHAKAEDETVGTLVKKKTAETAEARS